MSEATPKHRFRNQFNSYGVARQQTAKMKKLHEETPSPTWTSTGSHNVKENSDKAKGDKSKPNAIFLCLAGQTKRPLLRATRPRSG